MTLQDILGTELPIIQAPMAGAQDSALAAAVSNAGGLGSLPCAMLSPDAMREQLEALTALTDKPFNVNFFCHEEPESDPEREASWRSMLAPYYREYGIDADSVPGAPGRAPFSSEAADVLEAFNPAVVSFHFGLPAPELLERVRAWGSKILCSATTVEEARWLEARDVDAIIAQGLEAGGHRGMFLSDDLTTQVGTFALVRRLLQAVEVPVVAAGGIADTAGVAAAMRLGAAGVQIGTAYLLCPEAIISEVHRRTLKDETAHTVVTNVLTGRPARGITNRIINELGPISTAAPAFPLAAATVVPLRAAAQEQGRGDFSPLWSGQNTTGCREIPAGRLTRELAEDL